MLGTGSERATAGGACWSKCNPASGDRREDADVKVVARLEAVDGAAARFSLETLPVQG